MADNERTTATPVGDGENDCCCNPADLVGDITGTRSIPPFVATGVQMYSFPVGASFARLETLVDSYLNDPVPNAPNVPHWRPLGPMFYIQVLQYQRLVSEDYAQFGYISQNELVLQIPIVPSTALLPEIGFFSAYLVVDNPLSLTVGREVFGYPKTFGRFDIQPQSIDIWNWLTPTQGPNVKYTENKLLTQTGLSKLTAFAREQQSSLWPLGPVEKLFRPEEAKDEARPRDEAPPPFPLDAHAWSMLFDSTATPIQHTSYSVQALKEIDSTTFLTPGPQKAAYQARISARGTRTNLMGAGLLGSDPLTIHRYEPLDLIDIFGITTAFGSVPVFFPSWVNVDFTVHDTTLLTCRC